MTGFKLRIKREHKSLYHVEIHFDYWKNADTWVCFEHFSSKAKAKAFVVQAYLSGSPFDRETRNKALGENCSPFAMHSFKDYIVITKVGV